MENKWNGERIIALRNKFNLSQNIFSRLIGTRQQTISEWELNIYVPGNAYCRVLDEIERNLNELWEMSKGKDGVFRTLMYNKFDLNLTDKQIMRERYGRNSVKERNKNEIQKN